MSAVDDILLTTYGLRIRSSLPPRGGGERSILIPLALAAGSVRVGGTVGGATLRMEGPMAASTPAQLRANIDALTQLIQSGEHAVQLQRYPDREWHGTLQSRDNTIREIGPEDIATDADVSLEWSLPLPFAVARGETVLPGLDVVLAYGTAGSPMPLRIDVRNLGATPITQIVVTVLAGTVVLRTLTWAAAGGVLPSKIWSVSDESFTVTNDGASAVGGLSAGFEFPSASRAEGATRVTISATGGTPVGVVRYFLRW